MDTTGDSVTVVRVIKAPAKQIFAAWTDPHSMQQWLAQTAESDLRIGGQYRLTVNDSNGDLHMTTGAYKEVVPGRRLVMTWIYEGPNAVKGIAESQLTVEFRRYGPDVTELTLRHERISDAVYVEVLRQGAWTDALDKLEAFMEGWSFELSRIQESIKRV
jgi:uncharacterized protein YndB with AHSA1/START domain